LSSQDRRGGTSSSAEWLERAARTLQEHGMLVLEGSSSRLREIVAEELQTMTSSGRCVLLELSVGKLAAETSGWLSKWERDGRKPDFMAGMERGILLLNDLEELPRPLVSSCVDFARELADGAWGCRVVLGCARVDILRGRFSDRFLDRVTVKLGTGGGLIGSSIGICSRTVYRRTVVETSLVAAESVGVAPGRGPALTVGPGLRSAFRIAAARAAAPDNGTQSR